MQNDGGDVYIVGLEGNKLSVHYQGACGSCPSSLSGTLTGIENLGGSASGDTLSGSSLANAIDGRAGDDVIDIALEQRGGKAKPKLVAVEAAGLVAMEMLEKDGVLTIGAVSMPGSAPVVRRPVRVVCGSAEEWCLDF